MNTFLSVDCPPSARKKGKNNHKFLLFSIHTCIYNYDKTIHSVWLSAALISTLIRQCNRTVHIISEYCNYWTVNTITCNRTVKIKRVFFFFMSSKNSWGVLVQIGISNFVLVMTDKFLLLETELCIV